MTPETMPPAPEMNIYEKLAEIRRYTEVIQKDASGFNYKYVKDETILANITGHMDRLGVSLIPRYVPGTAVFTPVNYTKMKVTRDGKKLEESVNEMMVSGEMVWRWVNNHNPEEFIEVPWLFVGQQSDVSQAFGSALTYSARYFKLQYFNISTTNDDPDYWRTVQLESLKKEAEETAKEIIKLVDEVCKRISQTDKAKARVLEVVKRNTGGNANYNKIKDPEQAQRLLEDLYAAFPDAKESD